MKKTLQFVACLLIAQATFGQVLFKQDFESGSIDPMTMVDNDMQTPHPNVAPYSAAWTVAERSQFAADGGGSAAVSNSWYNPAGRADDWLITPQLKIEDAATAVLWMAQAVDPDYQDGYEVRVSTGSNSISDFSDVIWTTEAEDATDDFNRRAASLADYVGMDIYIAFRNNSTDKFLLAIDDISVEVIQARNVTLNRFTSNRFNELNSSVEVGVVITNNGSDMLTSVDLNWSDGTNTFTDNVSGLNLATGESINLQSTSTFSPTEAITYPVNVWTSNPNGMEDGYTEDDMVDGLISGVTFIPKKKVVGEEGTGTWCGWCPRGDVALKFMEANYKEEFIGIAVHNGDPMVVTAYDDGLGFTGFPQGRIDRSFDVDPGNFEDGYNTNRTVVAPLSPSISAEANPWDRTVVINTEVEFVTQLEGIDYRLSVVITEDGVTGSGGDWAQANYYSNQSNNISLPSADGSFDWADLSDPVPAADMVYDHVARAILGGFNGLEGSIPASVEGGSKTQREFTYDVPANFNISKLHAVVMVIDNATGQILNADKTDVALSTSTKEIVDETIANIYPNPVSQIANLDINLANSADVSLTVVDMVGNVIDSQNLGNMNGANRTVYNVSSFSNGIYIFKIKAGDLVTNKRIVVMN